MPRKNRPLPTYLTQDEVDLLRSQTPTFRDQMIVDLLYYLGLRVSELTALRPHHIDLKNKVVDLPGEITKRGRPRRIPIPEPLLKNLKVWLKVLKEDEALVNIKRQQINVKLKRWAMATGVDKDVHCHTLRHSYASRLFSKTRDLLLVKELLGHLDISTTSIYTHLDDEYKLRGIGGVF